MTKKSPSDNPNNEYAALYQKMMSDSLSHFDQMKEELLQAKEAVVDELNAAKEERNQIVRNAQQIAKDEFDKQFAQQKSDLSNTLQFELVKKIIQANRTDQEIMEWLPVDEPIIVKAKIALGFKKFQDQFARVYYSGQGRGGIVHFQMAQKIIDFHWEFAGGNSLALIFVPDESSWKSVTGYETSERIAILDFVAKEVIEVQANGRKYVLENDVLRIY